MPNVTHLDFETFCEIDLKEVGAWLYTKHPSFSILCLAYKIGDGPVQTWSPYTCGFGSAGPKDLLNAVRRGDIIVAHNAPFEHSVWNNYCVPILNWPELPFSQMDCTAARAQRQAYPGKLEHLAIALKLKSQKDMAGHKLMMKMSKPRKMTKYCFATRHEEPEDVKRLIEYCVTDVDTESEADYILEPLPEYEREIWLMTQEINTRGIHCDRESVEAVLDIISEAEKELTTELNVITGGEVKTAKSVQAMQNWLTLHNVSLPDLTARTVSDMLEGEIDNEEVRRVLEIRQTLSLSSLKKYNAILNRMDTDDRVRELLNYHKASPGRFGGMGVQIQNLPRGKMDIDLDLLHEVILQRDYGLMKLLYGNVMLALTGGIRGMFTASPGCELRIADWNAIEARILAWFADDRPTLIDYENDVDQYVKMASVIYSRMCTKADKDERWLGKKAELGAGYQMGPEKFQESCRIEGRIISLELAQKAIAAYRERHRPIVELWYGLQEAAIECVRSGKPTRYKKIIFKRSSNFLLMVLPSGRPIYYANPSVKLSMTKWGTEKVALHYWYLDALTNRWVEGATYGGLLTENACQGAARDLLVRAKLELRSRGYTHAFSVHDEIVTDDKIDFGSLEEIIDVMNDIPEWAEGLPLKVEGFTSWRYKK